MENNTGYYLLTVNENGTKRTLVSCVDPAATLARDCQKGACLELVAPISRASYLEYKESQNPGSTGCVIPTRNSSNA